MWLKPTIWPTSSLVCRALGPIPSSESQPIWLCSLCDVPPVVTPSAPGSPIIFDILFLESKNGQTIWPSTSEPMALLYFIESHTIWLKVLATQCDWGQQFDQFPLWHVEPLALSFNWKSTNLTLLCETLVLICMLPTEPLCDTHPVVTPFTPGSQIIFDLLFLGSKDGQTIWPSTSKSPWPCPGVTEANNLTMTQHSLF